MRRLIPILAAAILGSGLTAAAITLPARASERDERFGERLRAWQGCMRGQGFDLDGETTIRIEDGRVTIDGEEVDPDRFAEARKACGEPFLLPEELEGLPDREDLDVFPRLPDSELNPPLPRLDPRARPDFEPRFPDLLPRFPDIEPRRPDLEPRRSPDELPELEELRDRLERLENCLRGEPQEA
jgi:hypothetical protein